MNYFVTQHNGPHYLFNQIHVHIYSKRWVPIIIVFPKISFFPFHVPFFIYIFLTSTHFPNTSVILLIIYLFTFLFYIFSFRFFPFLSSHLSSLEASHGSTSVHFETLLPHRRRRLNASTGGGKSGGWSHSVSRCTLSTSSQFSQQRLADLHRCHLCHFPVLS